MNGPVPDARRRMPVVPKPHVAAWVLERLPGTRAKALAWEQIGASRAVQSRLFDVVVEESGIDSSAQIGLVLNRVHFAALQILHRACTARMLAPKMLGRLAGERSRCARGVPSIEISNRARSHQLHRRCLQSYSASRLTAGAATPPGDPGKVPISCSR